MLFNLHNTIVSTIYTAVFKKQDTIYCIMAVDALEFDIFHINTFIPTRHFCYRNNQKRHPQDFKSLVNISIVVAVIQIMTFLYRVVDMQLYNFQESHGSIPVYPIYSQDGSHVYTGNCLIQTPQSMY
jgi:hypothetical protein